MKSCLIEIVVIETETQRKKKRHHYWDETWCTIANEILQGYL